MDISVPPLPHEDISTAPATTDAVQVFLRKRRSLERHGLLHDPAREPTAPQTLPLPEERAANEAPLQAETSPLENSPGKHEGQESVSQESAHDEKETLQLSEMEAFSAHASPARDDETTKLEWVDWLLNKSRTLAEWPVLKEKSASEDSGLGMDVSMDLSSMRVSPVISSPASSAGHRSEADEGVWDKSDLNSDASVTPFGTELQSFSAESPVVKQASDVRQMQFASAMLPNQVPGLPGMGTTVSDHALSSSPSCSYSRVGQLPQSAPSYSLTLPPPISTPTVQNTIYLPPMIDSASPKLFQDTKQSNWPNTPYVPNQWTHRDQRIINGMAFSTSPPSSNMHMAYYMQCLIDAQRKQMQVQNTCFQPQITPALPYVSHADLGSPSGLSDILAATHLPPFPMSPVLAQTSTDGDGLASVQVTLENAALWRKFDQHCTEMIVTKTGR